MVVGIVIAAVVVLLFVTMKVADRRDRARGHVNRPMSEIRADMRANRQNMRQLRRPGSRGSALSPHQFIRRNDKGR